MMMFPFSLGCSHRRTSFPQTPMRPGFQRGPTYVCCLDCGKEFAYDWVRMKMGAEVRHQHPGGLPAGATDAA